MLVTVKVAVAAPAGTVTLPGTVAREGLLPVSTTTAPPAGATELKVTVPVEDAPPTTLVGLKVKRDSVRAVKVNVALRMMPL
jgi:hypothetical protein